MRAVLLACLVLMLPGTAAAAEFGAADDGRLMHGTDVPLVLDSMAANGVKSVRLTAWSDRSYEPQLDAARQAAERGLKVNVVLGPYVGQLPPSSAWFQQAAADFAGVGVRSFSILNEPDLWLPVSDRCDTDAEVRYRVSSAGLSTVHVRARVWRKRHSRARGHRRYQRVRYVSPGGIRRVRYKRSRRGRYIRVWRTVDRVTPTTVQSDAVRYEPRMGCTAIARARLTVDTLRRVVPVVRSVVPDAEVLAGETSPCLGVAAFTREVFRLGVPAGVTGWAHHPYPTGVEWGLGEAEQVNEAVPLPVFWTEFGVPIRDHNPDMTPESARTIWAAALAKADRLHIRRIVSYGWFRTTMRWDTAAEDVLFQR